MAIDQNLTKDQLEAIQHLWSAKLTRSIAALGPVSSRVNQEGLQAYAGQYTAEQLIALGQTDFREQKKSLQLIAEKKRAHKRHNASVLLHNTNFLETSLKERFIKLCALMNHYDLQRQKMPDSLCLNYKLGRIQADFDLEIVCDGVNLVDSFYKSGADFKPVEIKAMTTLVLRSVKAAVPVVQRSFGIAVEVAGKGELEDTFYYTEPAQRRISQSFGLG